MGTHNFLLCTIILEVYVSVALFSSLQLKVVCFVYLRFFTWWPMMQLVALYLLGNLGLGRMWGVFNTLNATIPLPQNF